MRVISHTVRRTIDFHEHTNLKVGVAINQVAFGHRVGAEIVGRLQHPGHVVRVVGLEPPGDLAHQVQGDRAIYRGGD